MDIDVERVSGRLPTLQGQQHRIGRERQLDHMRHVPDVPRRMSVTWLTLLVFGLCIIIRGCPVLAVVPCCLLSCLSVTPPQLCVLQDVKILTDAFIGAGSYGRVYECMYHGQRCAIKVCRPFMCLGCLSCSCLYRAAVWAHHSPPVTR